MPIALGTRIGPYEVSSSLGAGGMGEVYRARDTRLGRDVALKVLPDVFAGDPERLARFDREARTLASLNHPHIAHLHGVEESGQTRALVMELVEGPDLAERLRRGPIPVDDALAIARQIAQALGAAHEQGIIHRDLKPANIKVREDGTVKVLDFGLAKALEGSSASSASGVSADAATNSPTITTPAMTMRGVILGTAAYMAPEQAKGRAIDKRADIWAFGCVLYEMVTGRRAFGGEDVSDTLASVLKADVDWSGVPPTVVRLLKKCLERDPRQRLHDIGDAWDLLDAPTAAPPAATSRAWLPWGLVAVSTIAAGALAWRHFSETTLVPDVVRFEMRAPPRTTFDIYLAVSPDGRRVAFTARDEKNVVHIWVRDLATLEARRLPDTEDAWSPFWSPDSRALGFSVGNALRRIEVSGGHAQTVAESPNIVGMGAWNDDGVIVFGSRGAGPMRRVPAAGGVPVTLTTADASVNEIQSFPTFLPDRRRFLYYRQAGFADQGLFVGDIDLPPDQQSRTRLVATSLGNSYLTVHGSSTRLMFIRDGTLLSQPFDSQRLQVTGEPVPIAENVGGSGSFAFFSASPNGVLVYRTGELSAIATRVLTWVDRRGARQSTVGDARPYQNAVGALALARDGTRAATVVQATLQQLDLWLVELGRAVSTRFTFHPSPDGAPIWSPDDTRIVFRASRGVPGDLYVRDANGATEEAPLVQSPEVKTPTSWSRDGRFLLFTRVHVRTGVDVMAFSFDKKQVKPILETTFNETSARFSPDGRWIAYASNESGQFEISVRSFVVAADGTPGVGPQWQVSSKGGTAPLWRGDGREIFFRDASGAVMAADVTVDGARIQTSVPRPLFPLAQGIAAWDVAPDGQRFLVAMSAETAGPVADPVTVVLNWASALPQEP